MARRAGRTRARGRTDVSRSETPVSDAAPVARAVLDGHCALCGRLVERVTVHHLVPRARGGNHGPTAALCSTCHRQVHATFSVATLAEELYSVELLQSDPRLAGFLRWVRKQRGASFPVRRARNRG